LVWQEVVWPAEWGLYLGRSKTGHAIVDGGLLSNFPIKLIATSDALVREIMGEADPEDALNLGLLIDEATAVPGAAPTCAPPALSFTSFRAVQRVSRIVDTMLSASDNEMIRRFSSEICRLPAKGYGTLEFGMEGERLQSLLTAARTAMNEHLRSRGI
jgi:predicted acylesterase/phospholipase RssA